MFEDESGGLPGQLAYGFNYYFLNFPFNLIKNQLQKYRPSRGNGSETWLIASNKARSMRQSTSF